jgi:hypothetical protein
MVVSSGISDLYSTRPGLTNLDLISLAASHHFIALSTKGGIVFP